MYESKYFNRTEYICKCCGKGTLEEDTLKLLDEIREDFGEAISITSGFRCVKHNSKVGGEKNSQHVLGKAADIRPLNNDTDDFDRLLKSCQKFSWNIGNGINKGFIHIDTRPPIIRLEKGLANRYKREWFYS